jgi:hypothetical protein
MEKLEIEKQEIESILLADRYLTKCKFSTCKRKMDLAKRFLVMKIRRALEKKLQSSPN